MGSELLESEHPIPGRSGLIQPVGPNHRGDAKVQSITVQLPGDLPEGTQGPGNEALLTLYYGAV